TGWLGYTLSWSSRRFDALNDGATFPYRYDRRHDVSLVVSHQLKKNLDLGATWVYGTGQAITLASARYADGRLLDVGYFDGSLSVPELRQYGDRGGYRMAAYHRLDIALNWHFGKVFLFNKGESTLSVGAYNVYNRKNPFYLFTSRSEEGGRVYKQASLFPVLPFISYRFHF
ncbi:MAG: TonB-dependent receptor, partial [Rhodothermia bacterium]|nr:TonB-dependent receptor [Rhodothermia bacterium]